MKEYEDLIPSQSDFKHKTCTGKYIFPEKQDQGSRGGNSQKRLSNLGDHTAVLKIIGCESNREPERVYCFIFCVTGKKLKA